ncbi:hypothetical protein F1640_06030 [Novosphingobium sp. NBM11]|jgi:hypothetical protein|uniref:hypothetical protein n=1 Tax=Novosphingobium sp. NBM11 TaxID=2596914 RepID=UPI00189231C9|nr:hypothetical protein [Novosphingobium sp. NBM11]MBF5089579.1 hypothetical protein [Novosphingobium sp. NBM11]
MNRVKLSVRVPMGQEVLIRRYAEARGLTRYQALSRVIEAGLGVVADAPDAARGSAGDDAMAGFEARLGAIEALLDRSLFTASAAYVYARRAALRGDSDADRTDSMIGEAAHSAYRRQRALAAEALS